MAKTEKAPDEIQYPYENETTGDKYFENFVVTPTKQARAPSTIYKLRPSKRDRASPPGGMNASATKRSK